MKQLLTWLTLALLGSVVGVLATHLILIGLHLWRADRNLAAAAAKLEGVRDHTMTLGEDLSAINSAAAALRGPLHSVNENLRQVSRLVQA